jgi:hypothetical protein
MIRVSSRNITSLVVGEYTGKVSCSCTVEQAGRITEGRNKGEKEIPGRERAFLFFCSLFETPLPRQPILPQAIAFFCPRQKIILLRGSHAGCVEWITFTVQSVKCKIWQGMESRIQFMCINLSLWNPIFGFVFCVYPSLMHLIISSHDKVWYKNVHSSSISPISNPTFTQRLWLLLDW